VIFYPHVPLSAWRVAGGGLGRGGGRATRSEVALVRQGTYRKTIECLRDAMGAHADHGDAHFGCGPTLASRGEFEDAVAHHRRAAWLELRPDRPNVRTDLEAMGAALGE